MYYVYSYMYVHVCECSSLCVHAHIYVCISWTATMFFSNLLSLAITLASLDAALFSLTGTFLVTQTAGHVYLSFAELSACLDSHALEFYLSLLQVFRTLTY